MALSRSRSREMLDTSKELEEEEEEASVVAGSRWRETEEARLCKVLISRRYPTLS